MRKNYNNWPETEQNCRSGLTSVGAMASPLHLPAENRRDSSRFIAAGIETVGKCVNISEMKVNMLMTAEIEAD